MKLHRSLVVLAGLTLFGTLSACGNGDTASGSSYDIKAGDSSCDVEETDLDAGHVAFKVENVGSDVTEVYVYGKDGDAFTKIMGEKENIGPGTSQTLELDLAAGDYQVACKPGMTGDGIRTGLTVTGSGGSAGSTTGAAEESYDRELEFDVQASGRVQEPADLTGKVGEKIEFKLENDSDAEHYIEVLDPSGKELGEAEAHAGTDAEFVAGLETAGDYQIKIFEDGKEAQATTFALTVTT